MTGHQVIRLENARNGSPTLLVDGRFVHSRHDPEREAERTASQIARREPPAVVMLGLGLGYHAAYLLRRTEATVVVAFEPSREIVDLAFEHGPLADASQRERLTIVTTVDDLSAALPRLAAEGFESLVLPGRSPEEEPFAGARRALESFAARVEINRSTLARFGRLWVRNLCRNVPRLVTGRGVDQLRNAFAGVPVLLLAAGPSLDQVLPHLREIANRTLVVAVDTALPAALRFGVEPDFAVVVDPQYWNARHLDRVSPKRTVLVSEASAHPRVFEPFAKPVFFCSSVFPLGRVLEQALGAFGPLGAGGSVSTTAWDLARVLGAPAVYTAGLDLGFPGGRTHVRSSFFEELALIRGLRLAPAEAVVFRYTWGAGPRPIPANDGAELLSDRRMDIYRSWFASQLARSGAPPTFSLTRGGAQIDGLSPASLADLRALEPRRADINERLAAVRKRTTRSESADTAERNRVLRRTLQGVRDDVVDLLAVAQAAVTEIDRIRADYDSGTAVDFSPLAPLDRRLASHAGAAVGSFLIQESISQIRSGYGSGDLEEQINASESIYRGLANAAVFHAEQLENAVERIKTLKSMTGGTESLGG
ncbi:MAG: motility associated factor glycosyltransferase family protein [Spirochaetota bacterium]